ncbi:MAG: type I restriction endonuclease subunit R, partial [Propionibacteriaceae bacterium]|nr:type I restriction endonuclease subunit R [Propionibacteriaceae bacterium]
VALQEAFNQINRYQRESFWAGAGLFEWVQIFVISNGTHTKYYANTTRLRHVNPERAGRRVGDTFEFTMWWADAKNRPIMDLTDFSRTFFAKHTLLALLTRYCVFNADNELMVMRPYQIVATERILNQIVIATNYKRMGTTEAGGYIWHTTGSGKTLTSFKTAQLATDFGFLNKVLFVVDRQDLDVKTMRDFNQYQKDAVSGTTSTRQLTERLNDPKARIVVTTIQKLSIFIKQNPTHPVYAQHVAIIFDECHRSQFGGMHQAITKAFKNYHLFGFTGTPIFARNAGVGRDPQFRTTEQAFGRQLHSYTIVDAVRDKTVLPFKIDYMRTAREADWVADEQVEDIDRERALLAPPRIAGIVDYIIEHYAVKTKRGASMRVKDRRVDGFNSILATASIQAAKAYYAEFAKREHGLKVAVIYSFAVNEEEQDGILAEEDFETSGLDASSREFLDNAMADYNAMFGTNCDTSGDGFSRYFRDVATRLENRELDLLIVVNMFLTGFDAKTLNTLWVDKKLRYHGLIQAFSRTNRILNSVKTFGQIVCFRNLEQAVQDSIALFGDREASGLVVLKPYADYYADYLAKITELLQRFPVGEMWDDKKGFVVLFGAILRLVNILASFDEFDEAARVLPDRVESDYRGNYLDIYDELRPARAADAENINDDLVFEIELVKQVAIDLPAILALVQKYHDDNQTDKDIPVAIDKAVASNPNLRSKKDLIDQFIATLTPGANVDTAWGKYIAEAKAKELDAIIAEQHLNPEETRAFMEAAFRDGAIPLTGTSVTRILPPVSPFAPDNARAVLKATVLNRLREYYDRYTDV